MYNQNPIKKNMINYENYDLYELFKSVGLPYTVKDLETVRFYAINSFVEIKYKDGFFSLGEFFDEKDVLYRVMDKIDVNTDGVYIFCCGKTNVHKHCKCTQDELDELCFWKSTATQQ